MQDYTGEQIEVLKGLEAVRKRPGMYIGNTASAGSTNSSTKPSTTPSTKRSPATRSEIDGDPLQGRLGSVEDDGRGIPVDMHAEEKLPAVEVVMTILHAGGKFGKGGYKVSGGLHGVGISVVNALSEWMVDARASATAISTRSSSSAA
jgi:DNA gyrase subunit B